MRSILAASAVIIVALSGSSTTFAAPATAQFPALGGGLVVRVQVQAQGSSQPTTKQRRRARRPVSSSGGSNSPPADSSSSSKSFDPKKIWESD